MVAYTYSVVEVWRHSFLSLDFDGVDWSVLRPDNFNLGKQPRYPLNGKLGGPLHRSGRFGGEKILLTMPGLEPRIVQPVSWSLNRLR
jgi:hypothetical protein